MVRGYGIYRGIEDDAHGFEDVLRIIFLHLPDTDPIFSLQLHSCAQQGDGKKRGSKGGEG